MTNLSLWTQRLKSRDIELGELHEARLSRLFQWKDLLDLPSVLIYVGSLRTQANKSRPVSCVENDTTRRCNGVRRSKTCGELRTWLGPPRAWLPSVSHLSSLFSFLTSHFSPCLTYLHLSSLTFRERIQLSKLKIHPLQARLRHIVMSYFDDR